MKVNFFKTRNMNWKNYICQVLPNIEISHQIITVMEKFKGNKQWKDHMYSNKSKTYDRSTRRGLDFLAVLKTGKK